MLKQRARIVATGLFLLDLAAVAAAFLISYSLRDAAAPRLGLAGGLHPLPDYLPLLPLAVAAWGACFWLRGHYRSARVLALGVEARALLKSSALATTLFALGVFVLRLDPQLRISRSWVLLFGLAAAALLVGERLLLRLAARRVRSRGYNYRTVLIVGTGDSGLAIADAIARHPFWGLRILGFVTCASQDAGAAAGQHPLLGRVEELPAIVRDNVVDEVIFAVSRREIERLESLFLTLEEQGIHTRFALDFFPHTRARVALEELEGMPLLTFTAAPTDPLLLLLKRAMDVVIAGLLLVLTAPLAALAAAAIRATTAGPVLFRQTRCGLNGRLFTLFKFRTMVEDAEERRRGLLHLNEMEGPVFKLAKDPRVTPIGRLLRKSSLDELPQLWNVLAGHMSLVGPRPPIPEEVARYERWQRRRLSMKPGLTCLWQVSGRNEVDFARWMELDLEYIDSWSPLLDVKILLRTIPVVLSGRGAS